MGKKYDLLVLGAGISGCETAWTASKAGMKVLLIDMSLDRLNLPPFLPALFIGPDRVDGIYDRLEGTLFKRALETSFLGCFELPCSGEKIVLFDRREQSLASKELLEKEKGLDARQALINSFFLDGEVFMKSIFEETFSARLAAISPGSYIKGRISAGEMDLKAGRYGDLSSEELGECLEDNGVELREWRGYVPETLDLRYLNHEEWETAKEVSSPFGPGGAGKGLRGRERTVFWQKSNGEHSVLIPLGARSSEAYLFRPSAGGFEGGSYNVKAVVRTGFTQKALQLRDRGSALPEAVAFAGSFAGTTGYMDCICNGRSVAMGLLESA